MVKKHTGFSSSSLFFFNDTATTEIYTLSLHDALPISMGVPVPRPEHADSDAAGHRASPGRSEEHTSELQSPDHLVCRLLLEKKKQSTLVQRAVRNTFESDLMIPSHR